MGFVAILRGYFIYVLCYLSGAMMEEVEIDFEYLCARSKRQNCKFSPEKEDLYMARVRVLVIDQKKSNSEARRMAFEEII